MRITFNGKWEAERVARIVEMWHPANEALIPWRDDLVRRMRDQIDAVRNHFDAAAECGKISHARKRGKGEA